MNRKVKATAPPISKPMIASFIATAVVAALVAAWADGWRPFGLGPGGPEIVVYRDPPCLCCVRWIEYLRGKGFNVKERVTADLAGTRKRFGVPESLKSCHTAVVGDYVIEGHFSAEDIERLLT